ncbi:MAG: rhodanese-like domain-containing protein [Magnetococcales bacterium]|nr:rhodanese-like domain-containing protein [Magnetococcales bacterium]
MSWLQQNWLTVVLLILVLGFMLRGPVLMRWYGIGEWTVHDLNTRLNDKNLLLVDVRTPPEFNSAHIRQAILVPLSEVGEQGKKLLAANQGREVAVICQSGNRSVMGAVALRQAGFEKVYNVPGGMSYWTTQGYPVKR